MKIEIRTLNYKDAKAFGQLVKKLSGAFGSSQLLEIIKSGGAQSDSDEEQSPMAWVELGVKILQIALDAVADDAEAFLLSLIKDKPKDESDLPLDTIVQVLDQLVEQEDISNFFSGASRLFKKIGKLSGRLKGK